MNSKFALITFLDGPPSVGGGSPDNSLPSQPVYPSNGLPGGGDINNGLPVYPGRPVQLPVYPFDPTVPSNELPTNPPPTIWPPVPGQRFKIKWLACVGLILVTDNELPETAEPK